MPFLTQKYEYKITNSNIKKCSQYFSFPIKINDILLLGLLDLKQLTANSKKIKIQYECDECHQIFTKELRSITINNIEINYILCRKCQHHQSMIDKYGVPVTTQSKVLLQKVNNTKTKHKLENPEYTKNIIYKREQTCLKRFGHKYAIQSFKIRQKLIATLRNNYNDNTITAPIQIPQIQEKIKRTCLQKYGCDYPAKNQQIKNKSFNTIKKKYGEQYTSTSQVPEIKTKIRNTMFKNGTVPTSKQQKYFHQILSGELNYPLNHLSLDIALLDEKIDIEYNGGGHDLDVKLHGMTQEEFEQKEIKRNIFIRSHGWKQIFIISPNDRINLYTDEEYMKLIQFSKDYLLNTPHHWINIYLEEDKITTAVCSESIRSIIS